MNSNLFLLHDPLEDVQSRMLLRAYSVIPRFSKNKTEKINLQAIQIHDFLASINIRLTQKHTPSWKKDWIESIGYPFSISSTKDWFIGRASIPIIALEKLKQFELEEEVDELMKNIHFISSTTQSIVCIPKKYSLDLFYLYGIILGDGSLPIIKKSSTGKTEYKVMIHSGDRNNLLACKSIFEQIFGCNPRIYFTVNRRGSSWTLEVKNKTIYRFFTRVLEMPRGQKSAKAYIPDWIKSQPTPSLAAFLAGLVDSDIGKHASGMGGTFKSKKFVEDLIEVFDQLGIRAKNYGSHYKDNKHIQYDFTIPKSQIKAFKDVLERNYLPKRQDRLETLAGLTQGYRSGQPGQLQELMA